MSKCDFSFEFERADRTFRAGEVVRGSVTVSVNQSVNCRNLTLASTWRTHGKGNRAEGVYHSVNLFQGELVAGNKLNYPFEFQIPSEPVTYRGTLINVDHYVTIRADVPWAFDPVGEADFIVLPVPNLPTEEPLASFSKPHSMAGALIASAVAVVFILIGVLFIPFLGLGLIPIGIGIGIIFFAFRNRIAERKLGPVECVIAPASQVPGVSWEFEFHLRLGNRYRSIRS